MNLESPSDSRGVAYVLAFLLALHWAYPATQSSMRFRSGSRGHRQVFGTNAAAAIAERGSSSHLPGCESRLEGAPP